MSSLLLTSVERVKRRLDPQNEGSAWAASHDALLLELVRAVSEDAERICDRRFLAPSSDYVHDLDGTGTSRLYLTEGPLVSVTSVAYLSRSKDSGGDAVVTATTVDAGDYLTGGLRTDGCVGLGYLDRVSGVWTVGRRNVRVTYTAGFVDDVETTDGQTGGVPQSLIDAATARVAALFQANTELAGLQSRDLDNAAKVTIPMESLDRAWVRSLAPFMAGRY